MIVDQFIEKFATEESSEDSYEFEVSPHDLHSFLNEVIAQLFTSNTSEVEWNLLKYDVMLFDDMYFSIMYHLPGMIEAVIDDCIISFLALGAKCLDENFQIGNNKKASLEKMKILFDEKFVEVAEEMDENWDDVEAELNGVISNPKGLIS